MKIKKFLTVFLIYIFTFAKIPQAMPIILSDVYKQGIYDISQYAGYFTTVTLVTPDKPSTFLVFGPYGRIKYSINLETANDTLTKGIIEKGDTAVIVGPGEVKVIYSK